jgi:hypothetical protein
MTTLKTGQRANYWSRTADTSLLIVSDYDPCGRLRGTVDGAYLRWPVEKALIFGDPSFALITSFLPI